MFTPLGDERSFSHLLMLVVLVWSFSARFSCVILRETRTSLIFLPENTRAMGALFLSRYDHSTMADQGGNGYRSAGHDNASARTPVRTRCRIWSGGRYPRYPI